MDQNGISLERQFTGLVETYYANGNLQKKYSFVNGHINGECMEYDFDGSKRALYFYKSAREKELIREWYKSGQLKFEKAGGDYKY